MSKSTKKFIVLMLILVLTISMSAIPSFAASNNAKLIKNVKGTTITTTVVEDVNKDGKTMVKVTWKQSTKVKMDGYQVKRKVGTGSYKLVKTLKTKKYTTTSVKKDKKYTFIVRGFKKVNGKKYYTKWSKTKSVKVSGIPKLINDINKTTVKAKESLAVEGSGKIAVNLSWTLGKNVSLDGYQIYRSVKTKDVFKLYKTVKGASKKAFSDTNLAFGEKYFYKVRGYKTIKSKKYYTKWSGIISEAVVADQVWRKGNIYTVDDNFSTAESLAIIGDRLAYVGTDAEAAKLIGDKTKVEEFNGNTVLPGLIESHMHVSNTGAKQFQLDLFWAPKQVCLDKLKEAVATAKPGEWIQGRGWIESVWPGQQYPTKEDLDAIAPDNPVYLTRADGHTVWVNSLALELAGITKDTPNPQGGYIYRDENGEATGILTDTARSLISKLIPPATDADIRRNFVAASNHLVSYGFTSAMDAGVSLKDISIYEDVIKSGEFKIRADAEIRISSAGDDRYEYVRTHAPKLGDLNNMLDVMAVKVTSDGSMGGRSAAMLEDYSDAPGKKGELIFTDDEFYEIAKCVYDNGYQLSTHCIGDAAGHQVIATLERLQKENPKDDVRFRIEHYQCVTPEDMDKTIELGILPCYNSVHATSDMLVAETRWGHERILYSYAWRTMIDKGAILPNGSDSAVELVNPYHGLYAAVTRKSRAEQPPEGWYPEQCMTREEAVKSFTIWGAYGMFGEKIKGSLEAGKLADFVVIDRDVMTCPDWEIMNIQALTTVLGGEVTYSKDLSVPTVSYQGVPVSYNSADPYQEGEAIYGSLNDMANAISATIEEAGDKVKVTLNDITAELSVVEKDGIKFVNATEFYDGLGFKTQYQTVSNTLSIGGYKPANESKSSKLVVFRDCALEDICCDHEE